MRKTTRQELLKGHNNLREFRGKLIILGEELHKGHTYLGEFGEELITNLGAELINRHTNSGEFMGSSHHQVISDT